MNRYAICVCGQAASKPHTPIRTRRYTYLCISCHRHPLHVHLTSPQPSTSTSTGDAVSISPISVSVFLLSCRTAWCCGTRFHVLIPIILQLFLCVCDLPVSVSVSNFFFFSTLFSRTLSRFAKMLVWPLTGWYTHTQKSATIKLIQNASNGNPSSSKHTRRRAARITS